MSRRKEGEPSAPNIQLDRLSPIGADSVSVCCEGPDLGPDQAHGNVRKTTAAQAEERWQNWPVTVRKCGAEAYGVMMFVLLATLSSTMKGGLGTFGPAVVNGFGVGALILSLGHISGAHFNPSITVAFAITRNIHPILALFYVVAQLTGSFLGALLLRALVLEIVNTYFLAQVTLNAAVDSDGANLLAPVAVLLTVLVNNCVSGDKSGATMNPARGFGPAIAYTLFYEGFRRNDTSSVDISITSVCALFAVKHHPINYVIFTAFGTHDSHCAAVQSVWAIHYIYWIGPIIGSSIASVIYKFVFASREKQWILRKCQSSSEYRVN